MPIRNPKHSSSFIPFHRHNLGDAEIKEVTNVLKSRWITSGPKTIELEEKLAEFLQSQAVLAVNSATTGLFLALKLWGIGKGDEVITSPYSFVATSNVILECGAKVVFADVGEDFLIDPARIASLITPKTKAVITVDYGGYPCNYKEIHKILKNHPLFQPRNDLQEALKRPLILADSAHAIGSLPLKPGLTNQADIHCYSFHAVKNISCGEGGAISIVHPQLAKLGNERLKKMRFHGLNSNAFQRRQMKKFFYDMDEFGYKANLTDIQSSLLLSQLRKIDKLRKAKLKIAKRYDQAFSQITQVQSIPKPAYAEEWNIHPHLYTVLISRLGNKKSSQPKKILGKKSKFFKEALAKGVELSFHYFPIHLMSYYQNLATQKTYPRQVSFPFHCPVSEELYPSHVSLPFYGQLSDDDLQKIVEVVSSD